jgi:hypothetical protein
MKDLRDLKDFGDTRCHPPAPRHSRNRAPEQLLVLNYEPCTPSLSILCSACNATLLNRALSWIAHNGAAQQDG